MFSPVLINFPSFFSSTIDYHTVYRITYRVCVIHNLQESQNTRMIHPDMSKIKNISDCGICAQVFKDR
jgi:hypothetical protein